MNTSRQPPSCSAGVAEPAARPQPSPVPDYEQRIDASCWLLVYLFCGRWPAAQICAAFGIETPRQYAALRAAIEARPPSLEQLAAVAYQGPAITRLVAEAAPQDWGTLEFVTRWDERTTAPRSTTTDRQEVL